DTRAGDWGDHSTLRYDKRTRLGERRRRVLECGVGNPGSVHRCAGSWSSTAYANPERRFAALPGRCRPGTQRRSRRRGISGISGRLRRERGIAVVQHKLEDQVLTMERLGFITSFFARAILGWALSVVLVCNVYAQTTQAPETPKSDTSASSPP